MTSSLKQLSALLVTILLMPSAIGYGEVGSCSFREGGCRFEPAPPGQQPRCASPGLTFCVDVDTYPSEVIRHLVNVGSYDIETLLTDETTDDFSATRRKTYGYGPNSIRGGVGHISLTNDPLDPYNRMQSLQQPQFRNRTAFYDYYNNNKANTKNQALFNNHVYNPGYNLPTNGWSRYSKTQPATSSYNPLEWWRYTNPRTARTSVTIQKSISFPPISSVHYPNGKVVQLPQRRQKRKKRSIGGRRALEIAIGQANEDNGVTLSRVKRQEDPARTELCEVRTQYVNPRAALNKQNEWRYIVNMEENMTQLVRAEICTSSECNGLCNLPFGYKSTCEQKYIQKRLVALEADGKKLYTDVFWIPSCCQCVLTQTST